jgi:hypothetical protein
MKHGMRKSPRKLLHLGVVAFAGGAMTVAFTSSPAWSAVTAPNLGTAAAASVVAATTVTNTGATTLSGNLDLYPGTSVTGFPPGIIAGTQNVGGPVGGPANIASNDVTAAYLQAMAAPATATMNTDLGGQSLTSGVYAASSGLSLTGTVTLVGDASSVFIFQSVSTLIVAPASHVVLSGGVQACNVIWQVGSSATLGTTASFVGNILALTSISMATGASLQGRALVRNGGVTLDGNVITSPTCNAVVPTTTTSSTTTTTTSTTTSTTTPTSSGTTTTLPEVVAAPVTGGGPLSPASSSSPWSLLGFTAMLLGGGLVAFEGVRRIMVRRS